MRVNEEKLSNRRKQRKNKNIRKLIKYSRILGIENEVKKYVEVL